MIKLEKFDGTKTYMFPDNTIATPSRILLEHPAAAEFTFVLEVVGEMCQAVANLSALRNIYGIDPGLTEAEAIAAIEVIINTPPVIEVSAEERIASAMEFQNLLAL